MKTPQEQLFKQKYFWFIIIARVLFFSFFIFSLDRLIKLGTSPILICFGVTAGLLLGSYLSQTKITLKNFVCYALTSIPIYYLFTKLSYFIPTPSNAVFYVYSLIQHCTLTFIAFWIATTSTWFFWRYKNTLTLEIIALCSIFIALLTGHHQYHFDTLEFVNSIAWRFNTSQLLMLIIIIAVILIAVILYFAIANTPNNCAKFTKHYSLQYGRSSKLLGSLLILFFSIIFYLICFQTYLYHYKQSESRIKNGVGDENKEGLSPLDFHSGLGTSNQPVALIRLDTDYLQNPTSPMLYFRETAISDFNGKEMVVGDHNIDSDVSFTTPKQTFTNKANIEYEQRTPIVQSIYLLAEQQNAFAIDYPLSITRLKVPEKSNKFLYAYKAYSMAPIYTNEDLMEKQVGNPDWPEEIKQYYTNTNQDTRYYEFAKKIIGNETNPIKQTRAIINYLNQNVIYTLSPGQDIKDGEDPTSTFLFGDMRGYCVHFAHSINYLFRSLGIPSRIATGYATDLSQSKDGHILLRMNDRHAWAEVYIDKLGWIPYDLQPQNVESHAETPVDMDLLEELMDMIGPDEEILPESLKDDEAVFDDTSIFSLTLYKQYYKWLLALILLLYLFKLYLLYAWHLPASNLKKLTRGYRSIILKLRDGGLVRDFGETHKEFFTRISSKLQNEDFNTYQLISRLKYDKEATWIKDFDIADTIKNDFAKLKYIPLKRRLIGFLNLTSIFAVLGRNKW